MQRSYKNRFEHAADSASGPGRGTIAENCVEYYLFIIDHQSDHVTLARTLETLRRAAVELCQSLTNCYIWQRDEFSVELKISHGAREITHFFPSTVTDGAD